MSYLEELLRKVAGKAGSAIDTVMSPFSPNQSFGGNKLIDVSATLQNWGGNQAGSGWGIVKPTYAAEDRSSSGATGSWDEGGYTPLADDPYGRQVLSGDTGGNTGGGYNPSGGNVGTDGSVGTLVDNAQEARQSELSGILSRLSLMRDIAGQKISRAGQVRDNIVSSIGNQYNTLRQSAQNKRDTSLETLGQEDLNVQNLYGRAGGNARRALESALTRNRMLARAMNRLNSSFYDDMQANTNESGARTIADIGTEEAGKRAGIGTRMTETKNWYDEQALNLDQEESDLKLQAEAEYNDKIDEASFMERAYGVDALDEARAAEDNYKSRLSQIDQYIENKALRLAEISAIAGNSAGAINAFSAVNPQLQTLLSNAKALNSANTIGDRLPSFTTPSESGNPNYLALMRQNPVNEEEERLRQLFGYAYT